MAASALHLLIDAVEMLDAARDLRLNANLAHLLAQDLDYPADVLAAALRLLGDGLAQPGVFLRFEDRERQIIQFALDSAHAQPSGQWREDFPRFLRQQTALLQAQRGRL